MSTYKILNDYISERINKLNDIPEVVQRGIDTISGNVPYNLKLAITLSELITLTSHLRKPIKLYDGTLVPVNAIVFALSDSGNSKDKSMNALRRSLKDAYSKLEATREIYAEKKAKKKAIANGDSNDDWKKYYEKPKALQSGLGTVEGLVHHFADIAENTLGAGSIMSNEVGSDIQSNGSMLDIVKTISQLYDLGNISAKIIKSSENQTEAIEGLPVNALFFGSQEAILFNNEIKSKFKLMFNTQLARRSIFSFTPDTPPKLQITSIDDLTTFKNRERSRVLEAQESLSKLVSSLVDDTNQTPLEITDEANTLFDVYLEYNIIVSDSLSNKYPIAKLSRRHKQWLALKLAGNLAILEGYENITEEVYAQSIKIVEYLADDLLKFEAELVKESYEQLADMCKHNAEDGKYEISLHELRKQGYVSGTGVPRAKLQDLVTLVNSYDKDANYVAEEDKITYEQRIKTNEVKVSYLSFEEPMENKEAKEYMATRCSEGFETIKTEFDDIANLLSYSNAAYSSFQFKEGKRSKANVISGTKIIILDIDKSFLSDEEIHLLLSEYNHHIARTSDPDNQYKFRVVMELDSILEVDDILWKGFIKEVAKELGLIIDLLPKSQIYFAFKDREVLSTIDASPLAVKPLLDKAIANVKSKPVSIKDLPPKELKRQLSEPRDTFVYAYEGEVGERSRMLYRALAHAITLGADSTFVTNLAVDINNYWVSPMDEDRLFRTLINPALRRIK